MTIDHVYISPHLDDVVFSCGGLIRQQCANGERVLVVTVFTEGDLTNPLSSFAGTIQRLWTDQLDPFPVRRAEDAAAMRALGAEFLHMNYRSAMYRQGPAGHHLYQGVNIFGRAHPSEAPLTEALAAEFERLRQAHPRATFYVPLAIGQHVDHQLVGRAIKGLSGKILFYEDFPYVIFGALAPLFFRLLAVGANLGVRSLNATQANAHPLKWPALLRAFRIAPSIVGGPGRAQAQLGQFRWQPTFHPIDLGAKIEDTLHYTSQIGMLFGNEHNLRKALELYSFSLGKQLGVQTPQERLWLAVAPVRVQTRR